MGHRQDNIQYHVASPKEFQWCCSSQETISEKITHCSLDLKMHKQLTFTVTAFQDRRVLSNHGSQSVDISIRCCLIHHGQVDFLRWVTFANQTDTLVSVRREFTQRITQSKLSPTQVIHSPYHPSASRQRLSQPGHILPGHFWGKVTRCGPFATPPCVDKEPWG